jgi:hypothetical protein
MVKSHEAEAAAVAHGATAGQHRSAN